MSGAFHPHVQQTVFFRHDSKLIGVGFLSLSCSCSRSFACVSCPTNSVHFFVFVFIIILFALNNAQFVSIVCVWALCVRACVCEKQTFITLIDRPKYIYFATNGNGRILMKKNEKRDGQRSFETSDSDEFTTNEQTQKKQRAKSVWDKIAHTHKECAQSGFVDVYRLSEECVRWQWMAIHMIWLIRRHSGLLLWIRYAKQSMAMLVNSTHSDSKRKKCLVFDAHKHDFMNGNACYQRQIDVIFLHEKIYLESWDTLLSK